MVTLEVGAGTEIGSCLVSEADAAETWISHAVDPPRRAAYAQVQSTASWTGWHRFPDAIAEAPRLPGVYLLREPVTGVIRYVGMAGERTGGGRAQGLRGRLTVYRTGKGAVSGFGEAALDRALADPNWVEQQLQSLRTSGPQRAKEWAAAAISRLSPEVSWATTADRGTARTLEYDVVVLLRPHDIWNR
jgi:hypothetical protein